MLKMSLFDVAKIQWIHLFLICFLKKVFYKPTYTQTSGTNPKSQNKKTKSNQK